MRELNELTQLLKETRSPVEAECPVESSVPSTHLGKSRKSNMVAKEMLKHTVQPGRGAQMRNPQSRV